MKTKKNNILDLHGVKHSDVEDRLIGFFFLKGNSQCTIITGNSSRMKYIVTQFLNKHDYNYYIPSHNLGEIQVWD
jgi:hypothetical protein